MSSRNLQKKKPQDLKLAIPRSNISAVQSQNNLRIRTSASSSTSTFGSSSRQQQTSQQQLRSLSEMTVRLTDDELVNANIKELNDYLRRLPKDQVARLKTRRRLLKNRGYARLTRSKRLETEDQCQSRREELMDEIASYKKENSQLRAEHQKLRKIRMALAAGASANVAAPSEKRTTTTTTTSKRRPAK